MEGMVFCPRDSDLSGCHQGKQLLEEPLRILSLQTGSREQLISPSLMSPQKLHLPLAPALPPPGAVSSPAPPHHPPWSRRLLRYLRGLSQGCAVPAVPWPEVTRSKGLGPTCPSGKLLGVTLKCPPRVFDGMLSRSTHLHSGGLHGCLEGCFLAGGQACLVLCTQYMLGREVCAFIMGLPSLGTPCWYLASDTSGLETHSAAPVGR